MPPSENSASARVDSLLGRMTLSEKIGQMTQHPHGIGDAAEIERRVRDGHIGSFLNAPDLDTRNRLQRLAVEGTRLGIPLVFGRDVIHGYRTIFPIPLGQAASFAPQLVERAAACAAREAREAGIDWTFAPMVDITRDPRWGRVAETVGEDPYLAGRMGAAMVRGFQGETFDRGKNVAACAKHYVGYGAAEAGKDYNTTWIPVQLLYEVYLEPFKACVDAGVMTLMSGFNDLNGIPASGNELTLRKVLKEEWGFAGFVVSDWASLWEMIAHGYCSDGRDVAERGIRAGIDMEMASRAFADELQALVESGRVNKTWLDDAVRRILQVKERLGLFDQPYLEAPRQSVVLSEEHRRTARELAAQSFVLLKNENEILPLADFEKVALIGPLADSGRDQLGCWTLDGRGDDSVTLHAALKERLGARLDYRAGLPDCRSEDQSGFDEAASIAQTADVAVVVLGEDAQLSGECRSRAFLDLPGAQQALFDRLAETRTPLVVVVMAGRPLTVQRVHQRANALLYAWHPGTEGGPALADTLLGDVAPAGKLPITFPRATGQIPIYYAHKNTGRPPQTTFRGIPEGTPLDPVGFETSYLDLEVTPLFAFGFGLSYTSFEFDELRVDPPATRIGEPITVSVRVKNTGQRGGREVVQLYVRDVVASVTRPVRELRGFESVWLEPGQSQTVRFTLDAPTLSFVGMDKKPRIEPGRFEVFVGADSNASLSAGFELH